MFPLLLAALAKIRGRASVVPVQVSDNDLPRVAMIVSAYNEAKCLGDKLENTWAID